MNEYTIQSHNGASTKSGVFVLYTLATFLLLSSFLFVIDFVPERELIEAHEEAQPAVTLKSTSEADTSAILTPKSDFPTRIIIESIGVDTPVITPASSNVEVLDKALLLGAVHYPGSGLLGENGNVLIFGHSSYLPVVNNKAFKAFNELRKLEVKDTIVVESETYQYVYEVLDVQLSTAGGTRIGFDSDFPMLTLSTCNNFGAEEERWVVTAKLLSETKL